MVFKRPVSGLCATVPSINTDLQQMVNLCLLNSEIFTVSFVCVAGGEKGWRPGGGEGAAF